MGICLGSGRIRFYELISRLIAHFAQYILDLYLSICISHRAYLQWVSVCEVNKLNPSDAQKMRQISLLYE